jgi:hypothetical protein
MHPALPMAAQLISEHATSLISMFQHRAELRHATRLAEMLQEIIFSTTHSITEKQIEAILSLTKQNFGMLDKNLTYYMEQQAKFNEQYLATTDLLLRAGLKSNIIDIDHAMMDIRRDMEALHRFSTQLIVICGDAGLRFTQELSMPHTALKRIG